MRPFSTMTDNSHLDMAYQFEIGNDTYLDRRLSIYEEVPEPEPAYSIDGHVVGTLQNFSIISGQPKSKKTFVVSAIVAAVLSGEFGKISSQAKGKVLYIDTEQGDAHCQKVLRRIAEASGMIDYDIEDNLYIIPLRQDHTEDRLKFVEQAIHDMSRHGLAFVVIDGIRDLVYDINSPEESTALIDKLMEWTASFNIHILCILHENKGNNQLRGHLGSKGQNKAETVIHVEKIDDCTSYVEPKHTRNKEFPAFEFRVSPDGVMSMGDIQKVEKETPIEFDLDLIKGIANGVFREQPIYHSKQLFNSAIRKFYFDTTHRTIGEKKGYTLIETMEAAGVIHIKKINSRAMEITLPSFNV